MGPASEQTFLQLINLTMSHQIRPKSWNQQDIQPIPKPKDPLNPRPISLLSYLEKMVLKRLQFKTDPLYPSLYAYNKGVVHHVCP